VPDPDERGIAAALALAERREDRLERGEPRLDPRLLAERDDPGDRAARELQQRDREDRRACLRIARGPADRDPRAARHRRARRRQRRDQLPQRLIDVRDHVRIIDARQPRRRLRRHQVQLRRPLGRVRHGRRHQLQPHLRRLRDLPSRRQRQLAPGRVHVPLAALRSRRGARDRGACLRGEERVDAGGGCATEVVRDAVGLDDELVAGAPGDKGELGAVAGVEAADRGVTLELRGHRQAQALEDEGAGHPRAVDRELGGELGRGPGPGEIHASG